MLNAFYVSYWHKKAPKSSRKGAKYGLKWSILSDFCTFLGLKMPDFQLFPPYYVTVIRLSEA